VSNRLLFAPSGFERGFDAWREVSALARDADLDPAGKVASRSAPRVLDAVAAALADAPREHVFLYIHYLDVHDYLPARVSYAQAVQTFDRRLGELLLALERERLLEDSVVILTSDHGESLGERHAIAGKSSHRGNPSFQSVLEIPLIIAPPVSDEPDRMLRSEDLAALIAGIALLPPSTSMAKSPLHDDELLLTERRFLTYRRGPFKSVIHRKDPRRTALFDLLSDPGETFNGIDQWPAIRDEHRLRVAELVKALAARSVAGDTQTEADRERLRALGYLE
jgi:arylsulfatase A-like enzyme